MTSSINQVSRLRRKIEVDSRNPELIQTVRGGGYRLAPTLPVEWHEPIGA